EICGVFWGWEKDEYNESRIFQGLNERLLSLMGCAWDNPEPIAEFLSDPRQCSRAEKLLSESITRGVINEFFGIYRQTAGQKTWIPPRLWGWKDPRNTVTMPIWRKIFPRGRVIHIIRNGIDVSASLWKRETSRNEGIRHPHYSERSQRLEGCFSIWKRYVETGRNFVSGDENAITVRFEDLIGNPMAVLHRVSRFIHPEMEKNRHRAAAIIDSTRRFAYRNDPSLKAFRLKVINDPTMVELGYS
ncbi:MAG: hypothetical protein GY940_47260, partial [bacterium]|nr:hypothetical protein [bacterium]